MADEDLSDLLGPEPEVPTPVLSPGRALLARSRSVQLNPYGKKKLSPERMDQLLKAVAEMPVASDACKRADISPTTLKYWIQKSSEGTAGDGFDVERDGEEPVRFHIAWEDAMKTGLGKIDRALITRALGFLEPLTFQGRVMYKHDPELVRLFGGTPSMDTYLLDENGDPVPETVEKQDPDLLQFIAERRIPEYAKKATVDMNVRGGVLVVGAVARTAAEVTLEEADYKADAIDVEFDEVTDGDPT